MQYFRVKVAIYRHNSQKGHKVISDKGLKLKKGVRNTIVPSKRAFEEGLKLGACNSSFANK